MLAVSLGSSCQAHTSLLRALDELHEKTYGYYVAVWDL
jgi:hypothetical protein